VNKEKKRNRKVTQTVVSSVNESSDSTCYNSQYSKKKKKKKTKNSDSGSLRQVPLLDEKRNKIKEIQVESKVEEKPTKKMKFDEDKKMRKKKNKIVRDDWRSDDATDYDQLSADEQFENRKKIKSVATSSNPPQNLQFRRSRSRESPKQILSRKRDDFPKSKINPQKVLYRAPTSSSDRYNSNSFNGNKRNILDYSRNKEVSHSALKSTKFPRNYPETRHSGPRDNASRYPEPRHSDLHHMDTRHSEMRQNDIRGQCRSKREYESAKSRYNEMLRPSERYEGHRSDNSAFEAKQRPPPLMNLVESNRKPSSSRNLMKFGRNFNIQKRPPSNQSPHLVSNRRLATEDEQRSRRLPQWSSSSRRDYDVSRSKEIWNEGRTPHHHQQRDLERRSSSFNWDKDVAMHKKSSWNAKVDDNRVSDEFHRVKDRSVSRRRDDYRIESRRSPSAPSDAFMYREVRRSGGGLGGDAHNRDFGIEITIRDNNRHPTSSNMMQSKADVPSRTVSSYRRSRSLDKPLSTFHKHSAHIQPQRMCERRRTPPHVQTHRPPSYQPTNFRNNPPDRYPSIDSKTRPQPVPHYQRHRPSDKPRLTRLRRAPPIKSRLIQQTHHHHHQPTVRSRDQPPLYPGHPQRKRVDNRVVTSSKSLNSKKTVGDKTTSRSNRRSYEKSMTSSEKRRRKDEEEEKKDVVDVLDVDWNEMKKEKFEEEDSKSKIFKRYQPANLICRMGVSSNLLPDHLLNKIKKICDSGKDPDLPPLILDNQIASVNRLEALRQKRLTSGRRPITTADRMTSFSDERLRFDLSNSYDDEIEAALEERITYQPPSIIHPHLFNSILKTFHPTPNMVMPVT